MYENEEQSDIIATLRDMDNVSRVNFTPNGNVLKKKWMN